MKHILLSGLIICTATSQAGLLGETTKPVSAVDSGKSKIDAQVNKSIKPTEITDSRAQAIKALIDENKKLNAEFDAKLSKYKSYAAQHRALAEYYENLAKLDPNSQTEESQENQN